MTDAVAGKHDLVIAGEPLPIDVDRMGVPSWADRQRGRFVAMEQAHDPCWVGRVPVPSAARLGRAWLYPVPATAHDSAGFAAYNLAHLVAAGHGVVQPRWSAAWQQSFAHVSRAYAQQISTVAAPGALVWLLDPAMLLVSTMVRELRPDVRIGMFLHTPLPRPDVFQQLPDAEALLRGLLDADVAGFATKEAAEHFRSLSSAHPHGVFPTGVDVIGLRQRRLDPDNARQATRLRHRYGDPRYLVLSVGVLDHHIGVAERLDAFVAACFSGLPDAAFVHVTTAIPRSPGHAALMRDLDTKIRAVNEVAGKTVARHVVRALTATECVAHYQAADVLLTTTLSGGPSMEAAEFLVVRPNAAGRVVLNENSDVPGVRCVDVRDSPAASKAISAAATETSPVTAVPAVAGAPTWSAEFLSRLRAVRRPGPRLRTVRSASQIAHLDAPGEVRVEPSAEPTAGAATTSGVIEA